MSRVAILTHHASDAQLKSDRLVMGGYFPRALLASYAVFGMPLYNPVMSYIVSPPTVMQLACLFEVDNLLLCPAMITVYTLPSGWKMMSAASSVANLAAGFSSAVLVLFCCWMAFYAWALVLLGSKRALKWLSYFIGGAALCILFDGGRLTGQVVLVILATYFLPVLANTLQ